MNLKTKSAYLKSKFSDICNMTELGEKESNKEKLRRGFLTLGLESDMKKRMASDLAKKIIIIVDKTDVSNREKTIDKLQRSLSAEAVDNKEFVNFVIDYLRTKSPTDYKKDFEKIKLEA